MREKTCLRTIQTSFSVTSMIWALCEDSARLQSILKFIAKRLAEQHSSPNVRRLLQQHEPRDILNIAILKLLQGEQTSDKGRHVHAKDLETVDAFMQALGSAINNSISNIARKAETHYPHFPLENCANHQPHLIPNASEFHDELNRRELKNLLFPRLIERARGNPILLRIITNWEAEFLDADRIPDYSHNRKAVFRVRQMAREILRALGDERIP
jgi:hypothetical protein